MRVMAGTDMANALAETRVAEIFATVAGLPEGGPAYAMAASVCDLRGVNPHTVVETGWTVKISEWQKVIAEAQIMLLIAAMADHSQ